MKIERSLCSIILANMPKAPPEIGGILGGKDNLITEHYIDAGSPSVRACDYAPNVKLLNTVIAEWQNVGIEFMGMFHTHFWGVATLSTGDAKYIEKIMQAMPRTISSLYFPIIVMPEMQIIPYVAERKGDSVSIRRRELIVV